MKASWRWLGTSDPINLKQIKQTGATVIVSSLEDVPIGAVWPESLIRERKAYIAEYGLSWEVVESVPVHEDIKLRAPGHEHYIDAYCQTLRHLSKSGVKTVCYNFMPVLDWTRTNLQHKSDDGSLALSFDWTACAAFDLMILKREGAEADYNEARREKATALFHSMSEQERQRLTDTIVAGLPGRMTESQTLETFRAAIAPYREFSDDQLRANLISFLRQVLPVAEGCGIRLAIHPDDPPHHLLGLPRAVCTKEDLREIFGSLPQKENGLTFCNGTFSSRPDNDPPSMAAEFSDRIAFAHLRTTKVSASGDFEEVDHLDGEGALHQVLGVLRDEAKKRSEESPIFYRPDHGKLLDAETNKEASNPGYSYLGRLKGLAEIRGALWAMTQGEEKKTQHVEAAG